MFFICKECGDTRNETEVVILDCKHCFCLLCFEKYLLTNLAKDFKCPLTRCNTKVSNSQLRGILSDDDLMKYDVLCLEGLPRTHRCILSQCNNVIQYQEGANFYTCVKCTLWNCIRCNASHVGKSCEMFGGLTEEQRKELCLTTMEKAQETYVQKSRSSLIEATKKDISVNDRVFECLLCCLCIGKGKGIRLRSCFHCICRPCLIKLVKHTNTIPVRCPKTDCTCTIEDREVKSILKKDEYEVYQRKGFDRIKPSLDNPFQCRQANCDFFCELHNNKDKRFKCPKCGTTNCLICQDVHPGRTCREHQLKIIGNANNIEQSIKEGQFMCCPDCRNFVTKSRGCNWLKCPKCNLELCWIRKMRRWGPKGPGDTSGGCKCEANNFCHPLCTGCIPDL